MKREELEQLAERLETMAIEQTKRAVSRDSLLDAYAQEALTLFKLAEHVAALRSKDPTP